MKRQNKESSKKVIFNADIRKSNADLRRFIVGRICDYLRAICDYLRSRRVFQRPQKKVITAFLILILICVVLAGQAKGAQESLASEASLRPNIIEYKAEDLPDPFVEQKIKKPVERAEASSLETQIQTKALPTLTIQGIIWGGSFPQAIVNDKVVKIGDTIEEVRIIDINKNGLIINFDGQPYSLPSPATANLQSFKQNPKGGYYEK